MSIQQLVMAVGGRVNDATGGTITYSGDYQIHTFTSSGTFTVTRAGVSSAVVDVLVVAGGANGYDGEYSEDEFGNPTTDGGYGGTGGDGGQVVASSALTLNSFNLNVGYSVTVGAAGGSSQLNYQAGSFLADAYYTAGGNNGDPGSGAGGAGTNGTTSSITGTSVVYGSSGGGGGGGGTFPAGVGGTGGAGGTNAGSGGAGGAFNNSGVNGNAGTGYGAGGGGGGGAGGDASISRSPGLGGAGYQGIVVVRFKYQNI